MRATALDASLLRRAAVLLLVLGGLASPAVASAQADPDTIPPPARAPVTGPAVEPELVSPGGAFLRSLLVPGWGHMVSDSPFRGAVYVAAQTGTAWMIAKSVLARQSARRFRSAEMGAVQDELRLRGVQNPDSLLFLAEEDPRVVRWDELIETRGEQVEDWVALGLFLTLMGAADAFVAAHLADFPEPLSIEVGPRSRWGGVEVRIRLPAGRPHRR